MWKQITNPADIKNYPVGSKVRINDRETTITSHYREGDNGFNIADDVSPSGTGTFGASHWDNPRVTVEVWDEASGKNGNLPNLLCDVLEVVNSRGIDISSLDACKIAIELFEKGYRK